MRTDGVEITQQYSLDVSTAVDIIAYDFLVYLLCIAVRALGRLYRGILRNGKVLRVGLSVYRAAR